MSTTDRTQPVGYDAVSSPAARPTPIVYLTDGQHYELRMAPVLKAINAAAAGPDPVRMLAYNESIPGPTLRVRQGSHAVVHIRNDTNAPNTVHWHGLRIDNRYDGTHVTQQPIVAGGSFTGVLDFPDPGLYWYHPHVRTDYGLEMGLAGTILVDPTDPDYWPPAHRDVVIALDDVLITDGQIAPFDPHQPNFVAMGRYGNVLLANGETNLQLTAAPGEIVRLFLVNTANTRVFNLIIPGHQMKLVGGDSGHVEHEQLVDSVLLAPSERAVVDVLFSQPGEHHLEHRTPERTSPLATIMVDGPRAEPALDETFRSLRTNADMAAERGRIAPYLTVAPDKTVSFLAEMNLPEPEGATTYGCPMHPEVTSDAPGSCPKCGMKLVAASLVVAGAGHGAHQGHNHEMPDRKMAEHELADHHAGPGRPPGGGIEWEDDMVDINRITTPENMRWRLVDHDTGAANTDINDWTFKVGDQIKLRLVNEMAGDHPMHHPFHIHGAGRFLILSRDKTPDPNLVWKDTVLVLPGEEIDVLLDITHPGDWMAHCHIAEHHEANMMLTFTVTK